MSAACRGLGSSSLFTGKPWDWILIFAFYTGKRVGPRAQEENTGQRFCTLSKNAKRKGRAVVQWTGLFFPYTVSIFLEVNLTGN